MGGRVLALVAEVFVGLVLAGIVVGGVIPFAHGTIGPGGAALIGLPSIVLVLVAGGAVDRSRCRWGRERRTCCPRAAQQLPRCHGLRRDVPARLSLHGPHVRRCKPALQTVLRPGARGPTGRPRRGSAEVRTPR